MNDVQKIDVFLNKTYVGKMALTPNRLCAFEYDANYLTSGYAISPFFLPMKREVFVAKPTPFSGGFGVFDDCLPDGWGNLILDRYLKSKGENLHQLSILQRLALVGDTGRGALEFRPDFSEKMPDEMIDFDQIAHEMETILTTEYSGNLLDTLYKYGGSPGGARPKIFLKTAGKEWLVKFKATTDPSAIGRIEYAYSLLAKTCGINMPETQLLEDKYFATCRFDRSPIGKIHTISAAGLLHADYRTPSLDYGALLSLCQILTKSMEEVYALFRLMVFNVSIKNRDDHAKNFAFQRVNDGWKLAPAYDLLPSDGFNGYHTTTVNGKGNPTEKDMVAVAEKMQLNKQRTREIMEEVNDKVALFIEKKGGK